MVLFEIVYDLELEIRETVQKLLFAINLKQSKWKLLGSVFYYSHEVCDMINEYHYLHNVYVTIFHW